MKEERAWVYQKSDDKDSLALKDAKKEEKKFKRKLKVVHINKQTLLATTKERIKELTEDLKKQLK